MHEVHALIRRRFPGAISARTDWMFGFHRRGVRRCECDTDIPKPGPLPHTSHTAATVDHSQRIVSQTAGQGSTRSKTADQSNRSRAMPPPAPSGGGGRGAPQRAIAGPVGFHGYPPPVVEALDDGAVGEWHRTAVEVLSESRGRLDDLNVFPVPDGDTGTNLLLTAQAAVTALDNEGPRTTESAWSALARGAVLGARGNSGTIFAQLLRGLADQLAGQGPADGPTVALAMRKAADTAYAAVADPEEGTFLTVARAGARAAVAACDEGRIALDEVVRAAADGARARGGFPAVGAGAAGPAAATGCGGARYGDPPAPGRAGRIGAGGGGLC